jgi:hypothetical protein
LAAYTCDERCRHLAVDFQLEIIVCIKYHSILFRNSEPFISLLNLLP